MISFFLPTNLMYSSLLLHTSLNKSDANPSSKWLKLTTSLAMSLFKFIRNIVVGKHKTVYEVLLPQDFLRIIYKTFHISMLFMTSVVFLRASRK